ncbi:MAG: hypothetical protein PHZ26_00550 [Candidatus Gracilibacteria bacterium]|nr:hypothetical protein [Candidatus Gracilibacteria bacterium]MDD2908227.1 hypothetical protein [Candidatus Gracilibacteria bacterium]
MIKKILTFSIIFLYFVSFNTEVFADYIGNGPGMDFFKKLDSGSDSIQMKFMENELKGSAKKINDYLIANSLGCGEGGLKGCFDESKDFTYSELMEIEEDENLIVISNHLESGSGGYIGISSEKLNNLFSSVWLWFDTKQQENLAKEASMSRVGIIGLFNDGDVNNSGYDLMYDMNNIHKIIFAQDTNYEGTSNNSSSDFGGVINGDFDNIPSVFDPSTLLDGINTSLPNSRTNNTRGITNPDGTNVTNILDIKPSESNLCTTGSSLIGLDSGFLNDIARQLNNGTNNNSSQGGIGNQNTIGINNIGTNNQTGSNSTQGSGKNGTVGGLGSDSFPCESFICVNIEMIMYTQSLLGGGKSETIEGIVDKHLKIVNKYAGKSLIQSDMTKNFFSLSILRKLNLPSMLHLGIVITHLPVPILNLKKEVSSNSDIGEFKDKAILERTFAQNGLDYKIQNSLNPDKVTLDVTNCSSTNTNECNDKLINTQTFYNPVISNVNIMESKLGEKYKGSLNNDIAELVGFSNSFKANIEGILGTIVTIKKKIQ